MPIDVKENTIRARVRNPGEFIQSSFRTITIDATQGIMQVIGRLIGKTTTTAQSYIFDLSKKRWTRETVEMWIKDHGLKVI